MIKFKTQLGLATFVLGACLSSIAFADAAKGQENGRPQCSGERGENRSPAERAAHAAERFKKADHNSDGFLTQAEVGDKRWGRIQVADANRDGKVSQAELAQAHQDGKLGHGKSDKQRT